MMYRSKKLLCSGDEEYFNEKRSVNVRVDGRRTTPEFRIEFDKVWWGFLSLSYSILCCQTRGTQ
jgi:hypothetical protein